MEPPVKKGVYSVLFMTPLGGMEGGIVAGVPGDPLASFSGMFQGWPGRVHPICDWNNLRG